MMFTWFMGTALVFLAGYITNTVANDKTTKDQEGEFLVKG